MLDSKELISYTKELSIMFVEDHDDLRESTKEILKNFFHTVEAAHDGQEAIEKYKEIFAQTGRYYDIIISDIRMPRMNGVEFTKHIYSINPDQIIIILSAHDESVYLLELINLGIEQFLKKPIDYQELLRVLLNTSRKIQKQSNIHHEPPTTLVKLSNNMVYDRSTTSLTQDGENVYLTKYEIIFMQLLTSHIGKIFSNDDIVHAFVQNSEVLDAQNIRKLVSKLRKKIPEKSVESIYGIGYKFIAHPEL
ncbi:MAG: response regulator transcription factor [Epsilonproteobacteria bacterium]|nr:response regulator transcription factor [Campylobacterota bacterium]